MLDVNCRNSDGLTPLLLVTRDIRLFEKGIILIIENTSSTLSLNQRLFIFVYECYYM